jgi:AbrB family looped-hinge helix DNA binding protein
MKSYVSKVTKAGQISIPKEIRDRLALTDEEYVVIEQLGSLLVIKKLESNLQDVEAYFELLAREKRITPQKVVDAVRDVRRRSSDGSE